MTDSPRALLLRIGQTLFALAPWSLSLYLHFWLERGQHWAVDMPLRPLISAGILATGMLLSFFLHSLITGAGEKRR